MTWKLPNESVLSLQKLEYLFEMRTVQMTMKSSVGNYGKSTGGYEQWLVCVDLNCLILNWLKVNK